MKDKKILKDFLKYLEKDFDDRVRIKFVGLINYYKTEVVKKEVSLKHPIQSISTLTMPFTSEGFYSPLVDTAYVIEDKISLLKYKINSLTYNLTVAAHEAKHQQQERHFDYYNLYERFLLSMESILLNMDNSFYNHFHDFFFSEIDADLYAALIVKEYKKTKNNKEIDSKYLDIMEKLNKDRFKLFNNSLLFERLYTVITKEYNKRDNDMDICIDDIFYISSIKDDEMYDYIRVLFNDDGTLKKYNELLELHKDNMIDNNILNMVLGSSCLVQNIDYENINIEDLKKIYNLYRLNIELEKKQIQDVIKRKDISKYRDDHIVGIIIYDSFNRFISKSLLTATKRRLLKKEKLLQKLKYEINKKLKIKSNNNVKNK